MLFSPRYRRSGSPALMPKTHLEIRILNPPKGTRPFTSHSRAKRYVKQGRASWIDDSYSAIQFLAHDPRHQKVVVRVDKTALGYFCASNVNNDKLDVLLSRMKHVPIQRAAIALGLGKVG
jgi:hypothetical protein